VARHSGEESVSAVSAKSPFPSVFDERALALRRERMAAVGAMRLRNALWPGADDVAEQTMKVAASPANRFGKLTLVPEATGTDPDGSQSDDDDGGPVVAPARPELR
jgi:hypothetical protein